MAKVNEMGGDYPHFTEKSQAQVGKMFKLEGCRANQNLGFLTPGPVFLPSIWFFLSFFCNLLTILI